MSDNQPGSVHDASEGGVSASHPDSGPIQFLVSSATENQSNTVRMQLIPIACWRVDDIRFAFDSSFLNSDSDPQNDIRAELSHLLDLIKAHPGCPLSVFGHADPVGNDDYNKSLSGRRAMAVYALLTSNSDPGGAVNIWQQIASTERWGADQRGTMQALTGLPSGTADAALFRSYMQKLSPPELNLGKKDFLAQGADAGHKGDVQGCSEFNPLLIFSKEKQTQFDTAKQQNDAAGIQDRNSQNAINRRVVVLMFRQGSKVDPTKWPCPRVQEGVGGCLKRFWSDGEKRRSTHLPGIDRAYHQTKDTFACRFFDRLTHTSPCETASDFLKIRLHDYRGKEMPGVCYLLTYSGQKKTGKTNKEGFLSVATDPSPGRVQVFWEPSGDNPQGPEDYNYKLDVFVELADFNSDDGINQRLHNLGYPIDITDLASKLTAFQGQHALNITGQLDDATKASLQKIYGNALDQHIDLSPDDPSAGPREQRT